MKSYSNNENEREVLNKYKSQGKKKFVVFSTLAFTVCLLIVAIVFYILGSYLFRIPNYSPIRILLMLVAYTIVLVFIGLKTSIKIWERERIKLNGVTEIELDDDELKNLILKGEKIMAAKRYRIITGTGLKESIRYVDLISEYYSK